MSRTVALIEAVNDRVGRFVAWGILAIVMIQFAVVIMRYVFGFGSVWVQEAITYVYATVFMGAAGFAFVRDGHVRVDIFYREAGVRAKAVVDIVGTLLFLWPVTGLLIWVALPYVARSVAILEGSRETAGLPLVWLLKAEILMFAVMLALQGLALIVRSFEKLMAGSAARGEG
ncbi:MAG: TRAP transporter small permease subunit [Siculibacillus sp.]